jgi:hypothetical protein
VPHLQARLDTVYDAHVMPIVANLENELLLALPLCCQVCQQYIPDHLPCH